MTPEGKVKQKVRALLDACKPDCWYFMPASRVMGMSGVPDFIGLMRGRFFAVETKAGRNKPTALQNMRMDSISRAGGVVFVICEDNMYKLSEWLRYGTGETGNG